MSWQWTGHNLGPEGPVVAGLVGPSCTGPAGTEALRVPRRAPDTLVPSCCALWVTAHCLLSARGTEGKRTLTRVYGNLGRLAWQKGRPKLHRGPGVPGQPWVVRTVKPGGTGLERWSLAGLLCVCLFVAGEQVQTAAGEKGEEAEAF